MEGWQLCGSVGSVTFQFLDPQFEILQTLLHPIDIFVQHRDLAFRDPRFAHVVDRSPYHPDILLQDIEVTTELAVESRKLLLYLLQYW